MRQLSPREIRLSSPKLMTPAMMTKLASLAKAADAPRISSGSQLKEPATRSFIPSQLARASTTATQPAKPINDRFSNSVDRPQLAKNETSPELGRPVWPAISHKASPESPSSSPSFQPPITKESPISAETLSRMNQTYNHSPPHHRSQSDWRPSRPTRPPSPHLGHQRTLSHTLSPDLLDQMSRTPSVTGSPATPSEGRSRRRGQSVSLKGIKHRISSRNLGITWKGDRAGDTGRPEKPMGLFGEAESPSASTFPSMKDDYGQNDLAEFGVVDLDAVYAGKDSSSTKGSLASRLLPRSFGFGGPKKHAKRPSGGDPGISPPVAASFHRLPDSAHPARHARDPSTTRFPESPSQSPRSVKRKPVPLPETRPTWGAPEAKPKLPMGTAV